MTNSTVFENARFKIEVLDEPTLISGVTFSTLYWVTNKETGVTEVKTPGLLEAIMYAENCDRMLDSKPWEWARQAQTMQDALDGEVVN